jgi:hypothetical protein
MRVLIGLVSLLVLAWLVLAGYILLKEPDLLRSASAELDKRMRGVEFRSDLEISFFHDFPHITLRLSNVLLRDSLWQEHHHTVVEAKEVFVRFVPSTLFSGRPQVSKLFFKQGSLYLFTDSSGYRNFSVLRRLDWGAGHDRSERSGGADFPDLSFDRVRVIVEKEDTLNRKELVDLDFHKLDYSIKKTMRSYQIRVTMNMRVNSIALDSAKGILLKDRDLSGSYDLQYNAASKIIEGKQVSVNMDGQAYLLSGRFFADVSPDPFLLTIQAQGIPFGQATGLFPLQVQKKLRAYVMDNPVSLKLTVDAGVADNPEPLLTAHLTVMNKADSLSGNPQPGSGVGLHIHYKGPVYVVDSLPALKPETLDLDSASWAPFKKNR